MLKKKLIILLIVANLIVVGVLLGIFFQKDDPKIGIENKNEYENFLEDTFFDPEPDKALLDDESSLVDIPPPVEHPSWRSYVSEVYNFSFRHPANFYISQFPENKGEIILVRDRIGENSFQIYITPYDEPANSLTAQRVRRDLPSLIMENIQEFLIGNEASGLAFISKSEAFNISREVWFVRGEHLYQISAYLESQDSLQEILRTWKFDN